jgi:hypothetical protein
VLLVLSATASATMIVTYSVRLSSADRQQLEQIACVKPHGVPLQELEAEQYQRSSKSPIYAALLCKPHGIFFAEPMQYAVQCNNEKGRWLCEYSELVIHIRIEGRQVSIRPSGVPGEIARAIVLRVAASGWFEHESLAEAVMSGCIVEKDRDRHDPDLFHMQCRNGLGIDVVRDHPAGGDAYRVMNVSRSIP